MAAATVGLGLALGLYLSSGSGGEGPPVFRSNSPLGKFAFETFILTDLEDGSVSLQHCLADGIADSDGAGIVTNIYPPELSWLAGQPLRRPAVVAQPFSLPVPGTLTAGYSGPVQITAEGELVAGWTVCVDVHPGERVVPSDQVIPLQVIATPTCCGVEPDDPRAQQGLPLEDEPAEGR